MDWRQVNEGPKWVPVINEVEQGLGIPHELLARMAFQESSFLKEVIEGIKVSSAGALGILQLMPQFFNSVQSARPYNDFDVKAQITAAGRYLEQLYWMFGTWPEALEAYNFGPGNEHKYLEHKRTGLPTETVNYVKDILADVPKASFA